MPVTFHPAKGTVATSPFPSLPKGQVKASLPSRILRANPFHSLSKGQGNGSSSSGILRANPFPPLSNGHGKESSSSRILREACTNQSEKCSVILQSSFQNTPEEDNTIIAYRNGFVHTVVRCYSDHRALVLRPDDVWLAILAQLNLFINANAEKLRHLFVAHEGKKELEIRSVGTRHSVDFGLLSREMTRLIDENIVDKTLREWILPQFSTTTLLDTTASCIIMMATLKEYFDYRFSLMCGIPRVTLEGEKKDWQLILDRLEKLKEYGEETTAWYNLLVPVISRFVRAFDDPDAQENLDFWQKVAHHQGGGSGPTYLAGWITAFCVFNDQGKWIGHPIGKVPQPFRDPFGDPSKKAEHYLVLDEVIYPYVDTDDIPPGFAEVDVKLDDNGREIDTTLIAGLVGAQVCDSGDKTLSKDGKRDTARPYVAWWIFEKTSGAQGELED